MNAFEPGALDDVDFSQMTCKYNHRDELVSTNNKNLVITKTKEGLSFEARLPNTTISRDLLARFEAEDIGGCSFDAIITGYEYVEEGGNEVKVYTQVGRFIDVSFVDHPAYVGTDSTKRSAELAMKQNQQNLSRAVSVAQSLTPVYVS